MQREFSRPWRIASVDALRGFSMFWIIGGADIFRSFHELTGNHMVSSLVRQFYHASWHGFTFYDLIFPLFLFTVGVVIPLSLKKRLQREGCVRKVYLHIVKRTIILFCLGLLYNWGFSISSIRIAGVLQRIAICYFFTAMIFLNTGVETQGVIASTLLILYWALMKLVPVPGYGAGVLTPEGNLAGYVDRLLLPGNFCCYGWGDNEGILSTIPAISTTLFGALVGQRIASTIDPKRKVVDLLLAGFAGVFLGIVADEWFPINKTLWTSSYVLLTAGLSCILLSFFYFTIDVGGCRRWAFPFIVIGLNSVTIYMMQRLVNFGLIVDLFLGRLLAPVLGSAELVFRNIILFLIKWLILLWMYRKRIFIKV